MPDIVVFISQKFTDADKEKIAEFMRTHEIKTTTDIRDATVVLEPVTHNTNSKPLSVIIATEPTKPISTLADIAEQLVADTQGQLSKLREEINITIPEIVTTPMTLPKKSHHHKKTYPKQSLAQFNSINSIRNNKIFNRIKHK